MKYKEFLNEVNAGVASMFKAIDKDDAISLLKSKCKKNISKGITLYRGMRNGADFIIGHGENGNRKSIKISNHYTKIIDEQLISLDSSYPLRSKSVICTNYEEHASNFGTLYVVIPFDNIILGICDSYDIWYTTVKIGNFKDYQLYKLNTIWDAIGVDDTFNSLESFAKMVDNEYKAMVKGYVSEYKPLLDMFNGINDIQGEIIRAYSIKNLKIKFKKSQLSSMSGKHEVWFSGECIMIKKSIYDDFMSELQQD